MMNKYVTKRKRSRTVQHYEERQLWRLTVKRNCLMPVASTATWGHSDVPASVATEGHVWDGDPEVAVVCGDVCGPFYHQRPFVQPWSGLLPGAGQLRLSESGPVLLLGNTLDRADPGGRGCGGKPVQVQECKKKKKSRKRKKEWKNKKKKGRREGRKDGGREVGEGGRETTAKKYFQKCSQPIAISKM